MMSEEEPKHKLVNESGNENPWYVMMTIAGEQEWMEDEYEYEMIDEELHSENRRYWNGWVAENFISKERKLQLIAENQVLADDLAPLTQEDKETIKREIKKRGLCEEIISDMISNSELPIDFTANDFFNVFSCQGFIFPRIVNFTATNFSLDVDFSSAIFLEVSYFTRTRFEASSFFNEVKFYCWTWFAGTEFLYSTTFRKSRFLDWAYFKQSKFSSEADFTKAEFLKHAVFDEVKFLERTHFEESIFFQVANFRKARFSHMANFKKVTFSPGGPIYSYDLNKEIDCSDSIVYFNDAIFEYTTVFKNVIFSGEPPKFHNATLHEDTDWTGITWPLKPRQKYAEIYRRAYERLKLIMAQQNKSQNEHFFLRKELECREIENPKTLAAFCSRIYRRTSDYGWSVKKPALCLLGVWLLGAILIGGIEYFSDSPSIESWISIKISLANTFSFFGISRFVNDGMPLKLTILSEIISFIQIFLGLIFSFLLGLGLRNRFRIK